MSSENKSRVTGNKCTICGEKGRKGWFSLPTDEELRCQWVLVIRSQDKEGEEPKKIIKSATVCFHHFREDEILIYPTVVKPQPGKRERNTKIRPTDKTTKK